MGQNLDIRKIICLGILFAFLANTFGPVPLAQSQEYRLPAPGVMVHLSPAFNPPILKGIKVHPENPFRFDFILDQGDSLPKNMSSPNALIGDPQQEQLKQQSIKLIKYFLASLTIPEKDLWVNLSPYEKDRIIPSSFGRTEMGRDLLAEDYMLKQITASLIYPEGDVGRRFWKRIYQEAAKRFGRTNIPVNTFNKVWIAPEKAVVFENTKAGTAYVVESKLKVMLEEDYLTLSKHVSLRGGKADEAIFSLKGLSPLNALGSQIVREIVIPQLTTEVNENKNFVQLRLVYNSLILATWYKKKIKDSILAQVYADRNKITGVGYDHSVIASEAKQSFKKIATAFGSRPRDDTDIELIYHRYLHAFKKGVYSFIKEEQDSITQETTPRKYFSGGLGFAGHINQAMLTTTDAAMVNEIQPDHLFQVAGGLELASDAAMTAKNYSFDQVKAEILAAINADANRLGAERVTQAKKFVEEAGPEIQQVILMARQRNILLFSSHPQLDPDKFKTVTAPIEDIPPELMYKAHNPIPYDVARSQDIQRKDNKPGKNDILGVAHVEGTKVHAAGGITAMLQHEMVEETTVHELVGHKLALATRSDGTLVLPRWAWIEIAKIIGIEQEADIKNWPKDPRAFVMFMRTGHGFSSRSRLLEAVAYAVEDLPTSRYNLTAQNIADIRIVLSRTLFLFNDLDGPGIIFNYFSSFKGMKFNGKEWIPYYLTKTNDVRFYSEMTEAELTDFMEGKVFNSQLAEVNFNMLKDYYDQMIDEGVPLGKKRYHLMIEMQIEGGSPSKIEEVRMIGKRGSLSNDTLLFPVIVDEDGTWLVQRGIRDYPNLASAVRRLNLMLREGDRLPIEVWRDYRIFL